MKTFNEVPFRCPICRTDSYVPVVVQRASGRWYTTPFFKCFGCSVMFHNPLDFTLRRKHTRIGMYAPDRVPPHLIPEEPDNVVPLRRTRARRR